MSYIEVLFFTHPILQFCDYLIFANTLCSLDEVSLVIFCLQDLRTSPSFETANIHHFEVTRHSCHFEVVFWIRQFRSDNTNLLNWMAPLVRVHNTEHVQLGFIKPRSSVFTPVVLMAPWSRPVVCVKQFPKVIFF